MTDFEIAHLWLYPTSKLVNRQDGQYSGWDVQATPLMEAYILLTSG